MWVVSMTEICLTSQSTVAAGLDAEQKDLSVSMIVLY